MKTNIITSSVSIKLKFSNAVHKIMEPNLGIKSRERWRHKAKPLTDAEKLAKYEEIVKLHNEISEEYGKCRFEVREKRRVQKARDERGYVPKKKGNKPEFVK